jgi:Putative  PD-(D/E)XK family member, (DUF4420)
MKPAALQDLWKEMAAGASGVAGLDRRLLDVEAPVGIYACIYWPGGQPGLLVEGAGVVPLAGGRLPKCRGVKLSHEMPAGDPIRTIVRIQLEDLRLREIFAVLAIDLLELTRSQSSAPEALRVCIDRVAKWQGLFERIPADGLSEEAQRGLFGEIWVLNDFFLNVLTPMNAVSAWVGPDPGNQDFIHEGIAVEVKTSLAKRHSRLSISNEKQLDESPFRKLFLAHVRLDDGSTNGESLPSLVNRCRDRFCEDPFAARKFDNSLLDAGYLDAHALLYEGRSWQVSSLRFFHVHGDFPRLTEASLPAGVGDIRYSIIADDLPQYETTRDQVVASLQETSHGN